MSNKIAILRGINVGGHKKLLMADLKQLFKSLGYIDVKTYIQSGNVIFTAEDGESDSEAADQLEKAIQDTFGYDVPVIVRTVSELEQSVAANPFYKSDAAINSLHLTFLKERPSDADVQSVTSSIFDPDRFVIVDRDVFIYCEGKYHQSKLTNTFFEKKLKVAATTRNWKTVLKLVELSKR